MTHIQPSTPADCCGCGACEAVCPHQAIQQVRNEEGFDYPEVDSNLCVECGMCLQVCPWLQPPPLPTRISPPTAYAAWNLDPATRAQSSSGGIFSVLAEQTLAGGGQVAAAAFDESFTAVRHRLISSRKGLPTLRASKYVQSEMKPAIYRDIAHALKAGQSVLFVGCPCQVAGMRLFLGEDHPRLLTCDLACHGIPSPGWFAHYRAQCDKANRSPTISFSFRDKREGWKNYHIRQTLRDGREIREPFQQNFFMQTFIGDYTLRQTCYECRYKGEAHPGDLTLADFWGVETLHPEYDREDRGTTLLLVNTPKGQQAIQDASSHLFCAEVEAEPALHCNPVILSSVRRPHQRRTFLHDAFHLELPPLMERYPPPSPPTLWQRIWRKLGRTLSALKKRRAR